MARKRRWLLRLFFLVLLFSLAAVLTAPFIPLTGIRPTVEARLASFLGRPVKVSGMRLSLLGPPSLILTDMEISEDPSFGDRPLLQAHSVRARLAILPLLAGRIAVSGLEFESPTVRFTKNRDGMWSWITIGSSGQISAAEVIPQIRFSTMTPAAAIGIVPVDGAATSYLRKVKVENATLSLIDNSTGGQVDRTYRNLNLETVIDSAQPNQTRLRGRVIVNSNPNDGVPLVADGPFDLLVNRAGPQQQLSVQGSIGPASIQSGGMAAKNFTSSVWMQWPALKLDQVEATVYDGKLRGSFETDLGKNGGQCRLQGVFEAIDLTQVFGPRLQFAAQIAGHVDAEVDLSGQLSAVAESLLMMTGRGHVRSNDLFLASANVSQKVASVLRIDQLGDMQPGTTIGFLEADFEMDRGIIKTSNVKINALDALGDTTIQQGWITLSGVEGGGITLGLNFPAQVTLSEESSTRIRNGSPLLGAAAMLFAQGERLVIPITLTGDIRQPAVHVDVSRLFSSFFSQ